MAEIEEGPSQDSGREEVRRLVDHLFRHKAGQMVGTLTRVFGPENLELAEDVVQETLLKALRLWPYRGIPENPGGWLMQTAKNQALDVLRRRTTYRGKVKLLARNLDYERQIESLFARDDPFGDDQLTMIFLCCHPSLPQEAQVALTLKLVSGFGVPEIAAAFLEPESTVAQRLVRAKRKIRQGKLDFQLPGPEALPARLEAVLAALYLLFNEGYSAHRGERLVRLELCAEAVRLCSLLVSHPIGRAPKVHALLALMLLQASRFETRLSPEGDLLLLSEQDRSQWDRGMIRRGLSHLEQAASGDELSEYHLLAGIAACHAAAPSYEQTDWEAILFYYEEMAARSVSPVVALNRAVAVPMARGVEQGLAALEELADDPRLQNYYLLPATFGELYTRGSQGEKADACFRRALELANNEVERRFLRRKLERLG